MNNDKKITTNEILDIFSNKEERPSTEFEKNLKAECLKNFSAKKSNFILSIMEKSKKLLIAGGAFLVLLVAIGVPVTVITLKNRGNKDDVIDVNAKLAQTNLEELLLNTIKNNNGNVLNQTSSRNQTAQTESGDMTLSARVDSLGTTLVGTPDNAEWTEFNYSYWKSTYTKGPSAEKCQIGWYDQLSDKVIYESYNYWDSENVMDYGNSKYKSIVKTSDGTLIDYSVSDGTSNFVYRGGSYAILEKYEYPIYGLYEDTSTMVDSETSEEMMYDDSELPSTLPITPEEDIDPEDLISMYFGDDAKLISYELYNDEYHFVVEWITKDYYCGQSGTITAVSRVWIRESDFNWSKTETYLNSVKESNLISRDETISVNKKVNFDEVKENFENDYSNVEIKEYTYDYSYYGSENEKARMKEVLTENQFSIVIPTNTELSYVSSYLTYANFVDTYSELYCNRNFFPNNSFGDKLYTLNCEENNWLGGIIREGEYVYIEPEFSYYVTTVTDETVDPTGYEFNIYTSDNTEEDLKKMHLNIQTYGDEFSNQEEVKSLGNKTLTIGTTSVTAKVFSQTTSYTYDNSNMIMEDESGKEKEVNEKSETVLIIFNYDGKIYTISNYNYNKAEVTLADLPSKFTAYNSANTAQKASLFVLLDKMYDRINEDMLRYQEDLG